MVTHSHLKTLHPLQVFSTKSPPSSTLSCSMKIKTLIHTLIISHVCRIIRALSKAKTFLIQILKENQPIQYFIPPSRKNKHRHRKIFLGSFRLHYNWCSSSHVLPVPEPVLDGLSAYYDSTWNSIITNSQLHEDNNEAQLSGYLRWLEEKVGDDQDSTKDGTEKDINRLADLFIANCHEKFILEKQESYRRFQEMMARSM